MGTNRLAAMLALVVGTIATGSHAQPIYRCGNDYSQQPCAGGTPMQVLPDTRSPQQQQDSLKNAQRDARLAGEMEQERLRLEAQAAPAYVPVSSGKDVPPAGKVTAAGTRANKPVAKRPASSSASDKSGKSRKKAATRKNQGRGSEAR